jgi:hypothetical protein
MEIDKLFDHIVVVFFSTFGAIRLFDSLVFHIIVDVTNLSKVTKNNDNLKIDSIADFGTTPISVFSGTLHLPHDIPTCHDR